METKRGVFIYSYKKASFFSGCSVQSKSPEETASYGKQIMTMLAISIAVF